MFFLSDLQFLSSLWIIHLLDLFLGYLCSITMFMSDMAGKKPLYKKYVTFDPRCSICCGLDFKIISGLISYDVILQSVCFLQLADFKRTCYPHQAGWYSFTSHWCIERGPDLKKIHLLVSVICCV